MVFREMLIVPSNSQLFLWAVWMCSGLFWMTRRDAVIKLSGARRGSSLAICARSLGHVRDDST
jgi:hypothetical protein